MLLLLRTHCQFRTKRLQQRLGAMSKSHPRSAMDLDGLQFRNGKTIIDQISVPCTNAYAGFCYTLLTIYYRHILPQSITCLRYLVHLITAASLLIIIFTVLTVIDQSRQLKQSQSDQTALARERKSIAKELREAELRIWELEIEISSLRHGVEGAIETMTQIDGNVFAAQQCRRCGEIAIAAQHTVRKCRTNSNSRDPKLEAVREGAVNLDRKAKSMMEKHVVGSFAKKNGRNARTSTESATPAVSDGIWDTCKENLKFLADEEIKAARMEIMVRERVYNTVKAALDVCRDQGTFHTAEVVPEKRTPPTKVEKHVALCGKENAKQITRKKTF
ncbi:hypothetical protein K469DRAFT_334770 [Zopfia rhizophila CBS 207.26]|uniref:Uncharacterized protein n=1 Tax=Zopfia rhizophila CBS 207.26 TaxID=1314779 RepID=A0A6A6DIP1_9PEZI|nr:hypothetical protein K469DRAFT_334770 [Zopfia rhizophila CBS 207.26]